MTAELDAAREQARAIYEGYTLSRDARRELAKLSPQARRELEARHQFLTGRQLRFEDLLWEIDDWDDNRLDALAQAMNPLVEYWEARNGRVTTTVYSNRKKSDEHADDGASAGIKWLSDEMSSIVEGSQVSPRTILTMLEKLRT